MILQDKAVMWIRSYQEVYYVKINTCTLGHNIFHNWHIHWPCNNHLLADGKSCLNLI